LLWFFEKNQNPSFFPSQTQFQKSDLNPNVDLKRNLKTTWCERVQKKVWHNFMLSGDCPMQLPNAIAIKEVKASQLFKLGLAYGKQTKGVPH
jgi:hypothetical protein